MVISIKYGVEGGWKKRKGEESRIEPP